MENNSEMLDADLISHLPEHIVHHILTMIPYEDAASTQFLSKKWNQIWNSFPILEFNEPYIVGACHLEDPKLSEEREQKIKIAKEKYLDFINKSLETRFLGNLPVHRFTLFFSFHDSEMAANSLERWIDFVLETKVKELALYVHVRKPESGYGFCTLPRSIFNAKWLTMLRLVDCEMVISRDDVIKFTSLRVLFMGRIDMKDEMIQILIESCPLIEDLALMFCDELKYLQISRLLKLEKFAVDMCHKLERIQMDAPNLRTFAFEGIKDVACKIDLAASPILRELILCVVTVKETSILENISKFSYLEVLELKHCIFLESLEISSQKLQRLNLEYCCNLEAVKIDAPNLLYVKYKKNKFPYYSITTQNLPQPDVTFRLRDYEDLWFDKIKEFLEKYKHFKDLKLEVIFKLHKTVIIREDLSEIQLHALLTLKDLGPHIKFSSCSFADLAASHCRKDLQTLTIVSSSKSILLKHVCEKILNREEADCCRHCHQRFWWHDLRGISIEKFEGKREWDPDDLFRSYLIGLKHNQTSLRLVWKTEDYPETTPEMINLLESLR